MGLVEDVTWNGRLLAYIIRAGARPDQTTFLTPPELSLQLGFVVYPAGGRIARHAHRPLRRQIVETMEVLVVRAGRSEIDLYNEERELVATRVLHAGDVVLLTGGGHGFRVLEDTVFLEIKQGPYAGAGEKELF